MNKKTKRFLVTTLSVATVACGVMGWVSNSSEQKVASAQTATTAISLVEGASCRIRTASDAEQGSGIRFKATLDKTQWTALAESNEMIAGIMIFPTESFPSSKPIIMMTIEIIRLAIYSNLP